jgi:hypothetical protein
MVYKKKKRYLLALPLTKKKANLKKANLKIERAVCQNDLKW